VLKKKFKTKKERMKKTVCSTCFQILLPHGNPLCRICQAMDYNIYMMKVFCRVHAGDWVTGSWECVLSSQGCYAVDCVWNSLAIELLSPVPSCHSKAGDWWETAEPCSFFVIFQIGDSFHSDLKWHIQCRTIQSFNFCVFSTDFHIFVSVLCR
jgi:hypothetical protein